VVIAKRENLNFLNDFVNLPELAGSEACLDFDPEFFYSEFAIDIEVAKAACATCPLLNACAKYAIKHENYGVWGGMSAEERYTARGNHHAYDPNDVERLTRELKFIMASPANEVAAHYGAQPRTVVRWRNDIRNAQRAS
jgi:hypothetical protein